VTAAEAWRRALAVAGVTVVLDQATKEIAIAELANGAPTDLPLGFELDYVTNTGIAFGLLEDGAALVIAITAATLALLIAWFALAPSRPGLWLATGLIVGGALGNLADRIRVDAVTDFLDPPYWPAFNLADVAITAGVVTLVAAYLQPGER
jgi:signal peptidase II